jgi:hypothetical protein
MPTLNGRRLVSTRVMDGWEALISSIDVIYTLFLARRGERE